MKTKTYTLTKCYGGNLWLVESKRYFFYMGRNYFGSYWAETSGLDPADNPKIPATIPNELINAIERDLEKRRRVQRIDRIND